LRCKGRKERINSEIIVFSTDYFQNKPSLSGKPNLKKGFNFRIIFNVDGKTSFAARNNISYFYVLNIRVDKEESESLRMYSFF